MYENPTHTEDERKSAWIQINAAFSDDVTDWAGFEHFREYSWQRQLHIYEVPFYYIEYGIAQLGAIGLWMQFKQNPQQALDNYIKALSLGGMRSLPELYEAAGLKFDFSSEHINTLMSFVKGEMEKLEG
jgi:oligoendopeptidase F